MIKNKLQFRAEDDTDFMPIIPINENDEQDMTIALEKSQIHNLSSEENQFFNFQ